MLNNPPSEDIHEHQYQITNPKCKVIILSPHFDDAPLSLGGALLNGSLGKNVSVNIVFSISKYTLSSPGIGDSKEITNTRLLEEKNTAIMANYDIKLLEFEEPFVRKGVNKISDICNPEINVKNESIWKDVYSSLITIFNNQPDLICAPLGIGNHIDHRIVANCVWCILQNDASIPVLFYEDLPYLGYCNYSSQDVKKHTHNPHIVPLHQTNIAVSSINNKIELLLNYKSQLDEEDLNMIRRAWILSKGERIWLTESAGCLFSY